MRMERRGAPEPGDVEAAVAAEPATRMTGATGFRKGRRTDGPSQPAFAKATASGPAG